MIWTLICFGITFFVLKRFAFGPIQKTIDERRDRIRKAVEEADNARAEARDLLEQHKQLIGQAKGEAADILADARKVADAQIERVQGGGRGGAAAPARGDAAADRRRDEALARPDPLGGRRPDARGDRPRHRQGPRRRGPAAPDRRGDRRARLLRAGEGAARAAWPSRTACTRARSSRPRRSEGRLDEVAADLAALAGALEDVPELRAFLRNPQIDPLEKARVAGEIAAGADELVRNFLRLVAEKGRAGELVEMNAELEALVARAQNRLAVELTTAHELSDDEARSIVREDRAGVRPDGRGDPLGRPEPVGGVVLQVGSIRADGSVRGRLERLRQELVTTR